jgi:hypothetical protein
MIYALYLCDEKDASIKHSPSKQTARAASLAEPDRS